MPQDYAGVMHEWGNGELHSGSKHGKVVPHTPAGQKQAEAIAASEQRQQGHGSAVKHAAASHEHHKDGHPSHG